MLIYWRVINDFFKKERDDLEWEYVECVECVF
jgi:hypothetical protein